MSEQVKVLCSKNVYPNNQTQSVSTVYLVLLSVAFVPNAEPEGTNSFAGE